MHARHLLLALAVAACATPPYSGETSVVSSTTQPPLVETPTTPATEAIETTTSAPAPTTSTAAVDFVDDLGLVAGEPIESPEGFPELSTLAALLEDSSSNPFYLARPYQRARIFSGFRSDAPEVELAPGDSTSDLPSYVITYFDDLTVWDIEGSRLVLTPDGRFLTLWPDGTWRVSESFEPTPLPYFDWSLVQSSVGNILMEEETVQVVGYERLAGVETVRVRISDGVLVWLDESATVMRLVFDLTQVESEFSNFMIWDVETLDPEVDGPLPDLP